MADRAKMESGTINGFGNAPGKFDFPHHLAVDSDGSLYVAEIKNWRIQSCPVKADLRKAADKPSMIRFR